MRSNAIFSALASLVAGLAIAATAAEANNCTRLAFSVNDYGKEGPIRDAKALLDKYIASWAAENGVKKYTVGKKDVTCELFLDLILFDEHTCKASASVCWPAGQGPKTPVVATEGATPTAVKAKPKSPPKAKPKAAPAKQADAAATPAPAKK
jgi:hypothetical protein